MLNGFCLLSAPPPPPLFLTENINMNTIFGTKNTSPFHIIFQILKVFLIKTERKIQPPDLLFIAVLISFYISRYHFSQIFRTSFNIIWKTDFRHEFSFFHGWQRFFVDAPFMVKSKLPHQSGSHSSLEAVEPHPWKRTIKSFFHKKEHLRIRIIDPWLGR